jgi:hypothetical protein
LKSRTTLMILVYSNIPSGTATPSVYCARLIQTSWRR